MNGGTKHDSEKPRMDLLSSTWVEGVSDVLTFGAKKYEAHNWRKGIAISRLLGSSLRHIFAFLRGEDKDPETGLLHLYHASCGLMFASELFYTRPDLDDRYKVGDNEEIKNWKVGEHTLTVHECSRAPQDVGEITLTNGRCPYCHEVVGHDRKN